MSILLELVESSWCRSLTTALFHSLWQGVLIAGILFFYLRSMSAQKPHQRYNVSVMALALMFLSLFVTWGIVQYGLDTSVQMRADEFAMVDQVESNVSSGRSYTDTGQIASPDETETSEFIPHRRRGLLSKSTQWHQWFFVTWGIGFILMLLRLIASVFGARNMRAGAEVLADPVVKRLVDELRRNMELACNITIMVSDEIVLPCVTGFVVPLLLLPVSMVNGSIPTEELKVMLAHELAHIKRNDYFVNTVQMLVEAVLFFNPAVWLISRAVRIEREVCCDTFGSKYSKSPVSYAHTLAHWAQKAALTANLPDVMMPLYKKEDSGLIDRIERLICPAKMPQLKLPWHSIMTVIVIFAIGCYGLQGGTHKAVDLVSRLLTPQQRIDSMKKIAESYSSDSQSHKREVLPNKDQVVQHTLTQANSAQGVVVAKETGEPMDGVDVLIKKIYGNKDYYKSYWDSQLKIAATTDGNGFFTLNSLRDDCLYILMFRKGKSFAYAFDVSSRSENLSIELPQPYCIKGRFTGPLDPLESRDGRKIIDYHCFLNHSNVNNEAGGGDHYVPVDEEGRFEITNLSGNTIRIGHDQIGTSLGAALWNQEVVLDLTEAAGPQEKRKVVLKFDVPEGYPSPAGKVRISYVSGTKEIVGSYHRLDVPIKDYQAVFELPAPCTFRYRMEETIGYWFKEKWDNKLTCSAEPFIEHVEGIPSGAIYGVVLGPDGQEVKSAFTQVVTVQRAPYMKGRALDIELNDAGSGPAKFIIPSLPIGGTYAVYTKQENRYAVSEPIKITEENPIQHITLKLREGQSFTGRVLNETGNGLAGIQYQLFYQTPWTGGSGGRTRITLPDGTFSFNDINFDMPGAYSVSIEPPDTWMPQRIDIRPDMSDKTISLEKGKRLEGVVVENRTGLPIPSVKVHANSLIRDKNILGYLEADGITNEKGQFIFTRMSAKKYKLDTAHNQARPIKEYYIMGGQKAPVVIRVDIPESSSALPNKSTQPIFDRPKQ